MAGRGNRQELGDALDDAEQDDVRKVVHEAFPMPKRGTVYGDCNAKAEPGRTHSCPMPGMACAPAT
jgi:hypothetical protein